MWIAVQVTVPHLELANTIAEQLIEKRLAACVQISSPIKSIYTWEGKIASSDELLLTLKTHQAKFEEIKNLVSHLHSYEVPEIISFKIKDGLPSYFDWMKDAINL